MIYPIGCQGDGPIAVYAAHSDVVFPDTQPLPLRVEDGYIYCPGIGDDTGNVAALMTAAKFIAEKDLKPRDQGVRLCNLRKNFSCNRKKVVVKCSHPKIKEQFVCVLDVQKKLNLRKAA